MNNQINKQINQHSDTTTTTYTNIHGAVDATEHYCTSASTAPQNTNNTTIHTRHTAPPPQRKPSMQRSITVHQLRQFQKHHPNNHSHHTHSSQQSRHSHALDTIDATEHYCTSASTVPQTQYTQSLNTDTPHKHLFSPSPSPSPSIYPLALHLSQSLLTPVPE